jgi:hypothetical protein
MEEVKFGVLFFNTNDEKNKFIVDFNETLTKQKYKNNSYNGELNEFNTQHIFTKETYASWNKKTIVQTDDRNKLLETKKYRIIFDKIQENVYYFEKNGAINCINALIKLHNFFNFEKNKWIKLMDKTKNHREHVINYMDTYLKTTFEPEINKLKTSFNNIIDKNIPEIKEFKYDYFNFFNLFIDIKEIDRELKLPVYDKKECIDNEGNQSETIYNNLVFESDENKYILLDRKILDGCEVADLYDKENKLLFHNKKRGDLRVLSLQIIIGALIMKNKNKHQEYLSYLKKKGINELIDDNFKYVIGVIGNNKQISQKDKLSLGIVHHFLKQHNIELFIDFINEK